MTATTVRTVDQPSYFRNGKNVGAADIARGLVLKYSTSQDGVDVATASTDKVVGITTELHQMGMTRSYQNGGKCMATAGAAIAVEDELGWDAQGRVIPITTAGKGLIGRAKTAQATVGGDVEVEILIGKFIVSN